MQFTRPSMVAADGHRYNLVIELPPGQRTLFGPHGVPGLGILIAVISSGLVCFILARFLTSPSSAFDPRHSDLPQVILRHGPVCLHHAAVTRWQN